MHTIKYIFASFIVSVLLMVSCNQPAQQASQTDAANKSIPSENIVYIDIDTLLTQYDLYKDRKAALEEESHAAEMSLGVKIEAFQKRVGNLQQEFAQAQQNAANIAPIELKKLEDKFMKQQQNLAKEEESLMKQRDNAAMELEKKLRDLQQDLQDKIDQYLEKVADEKGYDFVLMKGVGGSVMYGRKTLDITMQTLNALNEEYKNSKG